MSDVLQGDRSDVEPLLLTAPEAAGMLGIGKSTFYRLHSSGRVPMPVRLGGAVRWRAGELTDWVAAGCPARARWEWGKAKPW